MEEKVDNSEMYGEGGKVEGGLPPTETKEEEKEEEGL